MASEPAPPRKTAPVAGSAAPARPRKPRAEPQRTDMRLTAWVALVVIALDQALKYWVVHVLNLDRLRSIDVLPPWLNLRMAWNQGVNFGLLSSDEQMTRWLLVGVAVAVCAWVWFWLRRARTGWLARLSAGLLIGGALGNVIDRLTYGAVADFLNMSLPGWDNPYSFNLADIAIFLGAFGLILMPAERREPPSAPAPARKTPRAPAKAPAKPAAKPAATSVAPPPGPGAAPAPDNTRDDAGNAR